jgi:acetoin utilization deacetylase AcuC-like enzyme
MALPIVHHPAYLAALPAGHRFPMDKYGRLIAQLRAAGLASPATEQRPEPAPRWWLELAHDATYVGDILDLSAPAETMRRIGLPLTAALAERARAAVGGTVRAGELALAHGIACNTAGGSHHAAWAGGAGFCVFNDVAVAARALQARGLAQRFLVIDLDVHQGDGTAAIFAGDPSVFTFSVHCERNYPARKQAGDLDVGLPAGLGDADYLAAVAAHLPGLLAALRPDLAFYNAGVDVHADDRLGRLALSDAGIAERDRLALGLCRAAGVPVAGVIGGGYAADADRLASRHASLHRAAAALA